MDIFRLLSFYAPLTRSQHLEIYACHVFLHTGVYVFIAEFVVQDPSKACTTDTMVTSLSECERAQAALDTDSGRRIARETLAEFPKGCYRTPASTREGMEKQYTWYFNDHATGKLSSPHEPICRSGKARILYCTKR